MSVVEVEVIAATDGLFPLLGVQPALGRLFGPADDLPESPRTVVLGHAYWQARFGGSREVVGETMRIDGEPFTSYIYPEDQKKPVLYPILTAKGTAVTRGYPLAPRANERVDHPHHIGLWFNYGDVNGLDFWNNDKSVAAARAARMGTIRHKRIVLEPLNPEFEPWELEEGSECRILGEFIRVLD